MSKAKDHLELYRIYQTNLKEIEGQFKDNLQNSNEEFKKLSQDHQNKIAKINKDYYDLLEIKKTENLDFLEMIKNARSELEIAEKQKFEDFKDFKKKLSDLAKIRNQQISNAREKAKETGVYPYEIAEIIEQSDLLKDKITKDFLDLKESSEQIIKNKSNKFNELLEIQKKLAKQDHKNNNDLSQNKEDSIAKQIQTYSASQDQINKKLSQHQELYENSKKILITLFENFRENIDKKNFKKPLDQSFEEDNSADKFLERIKPEEIEYTSKSSTSRHSQPKNLFVSPPTNPRIKKKRVSKKDQFTRHL